MPVTVKFNNEELSPTPLVSRNYQFIDFGKRWGQVEQIDLKCYITGINSDYKTQLNNLNTKFAGQFKTLEVLDEDGVSVYKWDNVVLQEVTVSDNHFYTGSFFPYNAKFIAYQVPSGVIDPVNEYSFAQSEDGIVTVNHRISARGIRTASTPLDNAIAFVNLFVKKNPYASCPPAFISNSSGVLMNFAESIDRTTATYTVNETYKYVTGINRAYLQTYSVTVNESPQADFKTVELSVKLQGSPVDNNLTAVQTAATNLNLTNLIQEFGLTTTNLVRDTFSVTQDSGSATVEVKASYLSGNGSDFDGYFDYSVTIDKDMLTSQSTWRVEGEYISRGPIDYRLSKVASFKTTNQSQGYVPYLSGLVASSQLFTQYGGSRPININDVKLVEDTGVAMLKLSATFMDYDIYGPFIKPSYTVEVEPSRWIYEMVPAANIEGHYVIQDLQMKNQSKIRINFEGTTSGSFTGGLSSVRSLVNTLSGIYVQKDSFVTAENTASGLSSASMGVEFLGGETMASSFLTTKVYGGFGSDYVRQAGFKFGY